MKKLKIVVSKEIKIKSWDIKDAKTLFKLTDKNRSRLLPWLQWVPHVKKIADSEKFIKKSENERLKGSSLELGIWLGNELVGCIGLHDIIKESRRASIGYWLAKDHLGKGIMISSVKALINYSFRELDLNRLGIETAVINKKSYAIAEKLGFNKEGLLKEFQIINGRKLDYLVFSLLKKDWQK